MVCEFIRDQILTSKLFETSEENNTATSLLFC